MHHKVHLLITNVQMLPCITIPVTLQSGCPLNLQAEPESVVVTCKFDVLLRIRYVLLLITDMVIMCNNDVIMDFSLLNISTYY